ncbi:transposase family protein [Actinocrinis puniceicyclus]|nr:transposase family protein [Actinocrinis puniceicyclus]
MGYQSRLPLSTTTLTTRADLLRAHLRTIRSPWRLLPPGKIALIVPAYLRHDQRLADLAGGNRISASTLRRWANELIDLLAARAPRLDRALKKIKAAGGAYVLLDGTLVRTTRRSGPDNRPTYSGKHKSQGLLFLALTDERGNLVWISKARRGAHSEIKATRYDKIEQHLKAADLGALADLGFVGVNQDNQDPIVITGYKSSKNNKPTAGQKQANQLIAAARAPNEHGFAGLKSWWILQRLRMSPARATKLLRALLVLTNLENHR